MTEQITIKGIPTSNNWRERIHLYMKETGMNQVQFAKALGSNNSAAVSQYLSATYKSPEAFEKKLDEFFKIVDAGKTMHVTPNYLPTSISEDIYATITEIHLTGGLAVECGDPGIGKTKTARKYAEDYPNNAIIVTVNPAFSTKKAFFKLLCRTCRIPEGSVDDMWYSARAFFSGTPRVLIIDEAQHLPVKTVDFIRSLADEVPTLGIVFLGNRSLANILNGTKASDYDQLISRTKIFRMRMTSQIKPNDIRMLFPEVTESHALSFLLSVAQKTLLQTAQDITLWLLAAKTLVLDDQPGVVWAGHIISAIDLDNMVVLGKFSFTFEAQPYGEDVNPILGTIGTAQDYGSPLPFAPVITVTMSADADSLQMLLVSTGRFVKLVDTIASGDVIVFDMNRGLVTRNGISKMAMVTIDSLFFTVPSGQQTISLTPSTGLTAQISYKRRYL